MPNPLCMSLSSINYQLSSSSIVVSELQLMTSSIDGAPEMQASPSLQVHNCAMKYAHHRSVYYLAYSNIQHNWFGIKTTVKIMDKLRVYFSGTFSLILPKDPNKGQKVCNSNYYQYWTTSPLIEWFHYFNRSPHTVVGTRKKAKYKKAIGIQ